MADKYIPNLPEKNALAATDIFAVDDNLQSYKVTLATLISAIPGVTGIALNSAGNGIVVSLRTGEPVEIVTHDSTKQDALTFDNFPTEASGNPVRSGGIYESIVGVLNVLNQEISTAREAEQGLKADIITVASDIAPFEASDVASQQYAKGALLIRNNLVLYKAKNTIEANTSIKPTGQDANVEVATVEDIIHLVKPVSEGGTGATTAAEARSNLGLGEAAEKDVASGVIENDTDLPTSGDVFTAVKSVQDALNDLGLYIDSAGYLCQRTS